MRNKSIHDSVLILVNVLIKVFIHELMKHFEHVSSRWFMWY